MWDPFVVGKHGKVTMMSVRGRVTTCKHLNAKRGSRYIFHFVGSRSLCIRTINWSWRDHSIQAADAKIPWSVFEPVVHYLFMKFFCSKYWTQHLGSTDGAAMFLYIAHNQKRFQYIFMTVTSLFLFFFVQIPQSFLWTTGENNRATCYFLLGSDA